MINTVKQFPPIGKSDHELLIYDLNTHFEITHAKEYLNYFKGNYDEMRNELSNVNWNILHDYNVEESWIFLKNTLLTLIEKHIQVYHKSVAVSPIWMTTAAKSICKKKNKSIQIISSDKKQLPQN